MTTNIAIFALAAFFEIAGCFAFWMWLRRGAAPLIALLGIASLIGFAVALTRVDSAFAGRAYAAYGGRVISRTDGACGGARRMPRSRVGSAEIEWNPRCEGTPRREPVKDAHARYRAVSSGASTAIRL